MIESADRTPRRVWVEIDLDAVVDNFKAVAGFVHPAGVMAVVKADAYGHGAVAVARTVQDAGAAALGTSTVAEGIELRAAGVGLPIVVLGPAAGEEEAALAAGLAFTVVDEVSLRAAAAAARRRGGRVPVHLKVDTGMTRLGVDPAALPALLDLAAGLPEVRVEGVCTHLAAAEADLTFSGEQVARFRPAADLVRRRFPAALRHVTATGGMMTVPEARFDMVRVGGALYGLFPSPDLAGRVPLRPAMSLWSKVVQVRSVAPGATVSYGRTHTVARPTRIATVAIGYEDGYPRILSNHGRMLVGGRAYPVVGRVTMDYTMVDIGPEGPPVAPGDPVLVFGPGLPVDEVAQAAGTISYEILCSVGPRVAHLYRAGGRVVGVRDQREASGVASPHPAVISPEG